MNEHLKGIILFAFLTLASAAVMAQSTQTASVPTDLDGLHTTVKIFFETISDETAGPQKGLEELLKNSPITREDREKTILALSNNIREITRRFGPCLSFESIGAKMIGRDLIVLRYLYKCRDYPVVWYFTFYRAGGDTDTESGSGGVWTLIHFYYDSNLNIQNWESF